MANGELSNPFTLLPFYHLTILHLIIFHSSYPLSFYCFPHILGRSSESLDFSELNPENGCCSDENRRGGGRIYQMVKCKMVKGQTPSYQTILPFYHFTILHLIISRIQFERNPVF